jgi:sugar phosphate isomerase/epimerase
MFTRRQFGALALSAVPLARAASFDSVQIGNQSYSFRDMPLDAAIQAMAAMGLKECELSQGHMEPPKLDREALRQWRLTVPLDEFRNVRKKFDAAGVHLHSYSYNIKDDFTDEEIARGFAMTKALGVDWFTASATVSVTPRIDKVAAREKIYVGMHNHANLKDPNEFASPVAWEKAMQGSSRYIAINLDIGHFTAANFDPVDFLVKHHAHILTLHLKDRKKNGGPNMPFGEGDTPIKEVLQVLKKNKYPIYANIEYEYKGGDTVTEVKRCLDYCRNALA